MSDYHNQQAFEARLAGRHANPRTPSPVQVFYHVSCMGNWQQVIIEQLRLLAHVGLTEAVSCVLGSAEDARWLEQKARQEGVRLCIASQTADLGLYEGPTLGALYAWCRDNPTGCAFYFHTKGVSNPDDPRKARWRRVMQKHVLGDWRVNVERLALYDILGVGWVTSGDFPHFPGNFWAARADWIASLEPPSVYRHRHPHLRWASHSWPDRMYVETWLGSQGYHHVGELTWNNCGLWEGTDLWSLPYEVEGLGYVGGAADYAECRELCIDLGGGAGYGTCDYLNIDREAEPGKGLRADFESEPLPFADDSVAAIHSAHCFEHIQNLRHLLREVARVCRVGARVYLRLPHWLSPMALCHDHKQIIPPEQIDHWCRSTLDYWWRGSPKRLAHQWTKQKPSASFSEAKELFPHLSEEQLMRFIPGAAQEVEYMLEVVPHAS